MHKEDNIKKFKKDHTNKNIWISNKYDCSKILQTYCEDMNIFLIQNEIYLITNDFYFEEFKKRFNFLKVLNSKESPFKNIIIPLVEKSDKKLLINENELSIKEYFLIKEKYKTIEFILTDFQYLKTIKSEFDIKNLKTASSISNDIFKKILPFIKLGVTEIEIKKIIQKLIIDSKASKESFDIIVAFGENTSSPHHRPSNYKLKQKDWVTIDFGVNYEGYCTDITRTFFIFEQNYLNEEQIKIFSIIKESLEVGMKLVKDGQEIGKIDEAIRGFIESNGYGKYFIHTSGHGIGLEVHEIPYIYSGNKNILEENMFITLEPGIYIPNKFGCRLEVNLLVKKNGFERLDSNNLNLFFKHK